MSQPTCIVPRPAASNTTCSNCASSLPNQDKGTLGEALGTQELEKILTEETGCHRQRIYPPMVTLRLFIDQILSTDQACQEAVSQRLVARVVQGHKHLGGQLERCAAPQWGWRGRSVKLFDATVSMPDTLQNQQSWPQSTRQKPGLGFPLARIGALISLSSGAVIDYAVGPMKGKCSGEQALLRELSGSLSRNRPLAGRCLAQHLVGRADAGAARR